MKNILKYSGYIIAAYLIIGAMATVYIPNLLLTYTQNILSNSTQEINKTQTYDKKY